VALVEDLTLECSSHLIVHIVKAIRGRNPSTVSQLDKSGFEFLEGLALAYTEVLIRVIGVTPVERVLVNSVKYTQHL
jgi:hypothetical protein